MIPSPEAHLSRKFPHPSRSLGRRELQRTVDVLPSYVLLLPQGLMGTL